MSISVGIVGAAGFAGAELLRLVLGHPEFELKVATSDSLAGTLLSESNPSLLGHTELRYSGHDDSNLRACDAVFLAVPHKAALTLVPPLLSAGVSLFDLSADYRLKDQQLYEIWYETVHTSPELLSRAAFGLPELCAEDLQATALHYKQGEAILVACAGCYPTAISLAAAPVVRAGLIKPPLIADAISGVTGAGKATTERSHFCFANESLEAYGVGKHRHTPEIEQILGLSAGQLIFTPHLAPLNRGILATVYLPLTEAAAKESSLEELSALYQSFYKGKAFVKVLAQGKLPRTSSVAGSNYVHIGLSYQEATRTLVAIAAIDNVCKGAAGQAVQCANIVFGLPETAGLSAPARYA